MAKSNICFHNVRLNLDNEQHCRVHKVLMGLNKEIHKSTNQFIVDAVDYYIRSLDDEELVNRAEGQRKAAEYIVKADLDGIRAELKSEVKSEIIMLLGAALGVGAGRTLGNITSNYADVAVGKTNDTTAEADDPTMIELVDNWG